MAAILEQQAQLAISIWTGRDLAILLGRQRASSIWELLTSPVVGGCRRSEDKSGLEACRHAAARAAVEQVGILVGASELTPLWYVVDEPPTQGTWVFLVHAARADHPIPLGPLAEVWWSTPDHVCRRAAGGALEVEQTTLLTLDRLRPDLLAIHGLSADG